MTVEAFDWEALARYLAGECTPAEAAKIRAWLDEEPARRMLVDQMDAHLSRYQPQNAVPVDVDSALNRVHARLADEDISEDVIPLRRPSPIPYWLGIAAAVMLVISAAIVWRTVIDRGGTPGLTTAFATAIGETDSLRLADGTLVVLGPGSTLSAVADYPRRREVSLSGDAYFDVVDVAAPFIVMAGTTEIVDLGTAFTVHSAPGNRVRVAVTSGSVALRQAPSANGEEIVLREGDRAALRSGALTVERGVVTSEDLAWTRGTLAFAEATLIEIAFDFRRWYGVEIVAADPALESRRITASFSGESAAEALEVIRLALGTALTLSGDTAVLGVQPAP